MRVRAIIAAFGLAAGTLFAGASATTASAATSHTVAKPSFMQGSNVPASNAWKEANGVPLTDTCYTDQAWDNVDSFSPPYQSYIGVSDATYRVVEAGFTSWPDSGQDEWGTCYDPVANRWGFESNYVAKWVLPNGTTDLIANSSTYGVDEEFYKAASTGWPGEGDALEAVLGARWVQTSSSSPYELYMGAGSQSQGFPYCVEEAWNGDGNGC